MYLNNMTIMDSDIFSLLSVHAWWTLPSPSFRPEWAHSAESFVFNLYLWLHFPLEELEEPCQFSYM